MITAPRAQQPGVIDNYYSLVRKEFQSKNAYATVGFVEKYWRLAGNTGFNATVFEIEKILRSAGFKKEINGEADGTLTYRIEKRAMKRPTWEPVSSSITIAGESAPLLESVTNRNMIAINSFSTKPEGSTAEVIYIGKGARADWEGKDVNGKIVFADAGVGGLFQEAMRRGAIGVLGYRMPAYTQPEKYTHSIQFQNIPLDTVKRSWGIVLSFDARQRLKAALEKGPVRVTVKTLTKVYPSEELTIVANVRGSESPDERFVFSAHIQEPGANDNATGVGTLAEMARITGLAVANGRLKPKRTITFLWGDEIISTGRYISDDPVRAKGIKWGLSLDMVGEDIAKTGGTFLIEKMPDPSAIWTRGLEKHSEWGGSVLKESDLFPHYFNDLLLNRCRQQAKENGWIVKTNPFEGGSDHTPFLQAKIPGLLMWHFTDVFYHTDADRLNMVSPEEMRNVGISALTTAYTLTSADEQVTLALVAELSKNALDRLATEFELSRDAVKNGGQVENEKHILDTWSNWYIAAIGKMDEINVKGATPKIKYAIATAQKTIGFRLSALNRMLASN